MKRESVLTCIVLFVFVFSTSNLFAAAQWISYDNFDSGTIDAGKWQLGACGNGNTPVASNGGVSFTGGPNLCDSMMQPINYGDAYGFQADLQLISFTPDAQSEEGGQIQIEMGLSGDYGASVEVSTLDGINYYVETSIEYDFGGEYFVLVGQQFDITPCDIIKAGLAFNDDTDSVDFYINSSLLWSYDSSHPDYNPATAAGFALSGFNMGVYAEGSYEAFSDNAEMLVPEPATLLLLGLGSLVLRRQRA